MANSCVGGFHEDRIGSWCNNCRVCNCQGCRARDELADRDACLAQGNVETRVGSAVR